MIMKTHRFLLFAIAIPLGIGLVIGTYWYTQHKKTLPPKTSFGNSKPRSKTPGIILQGVATKNIDEKGQPIDQTEQFSIKQTPVYIVVKLQTPSVGTKIEYVRYLNGKYLDHKSITINQTHAQYTNFQWHLKSPLATHLPGTYLVKLYTNGVFEKSVNFAISRTVAGGYELSYNQK